MRLKLLFEEIETEVELHETPCARALFEATPFEAIGHRWGEEIYFETPVSFELDETAKEVVEEGDVGFWPQGKALCLFFGPTPISGPGEIRPASAVNIVGKIRGPLSDLKQVKDGEKVRVEKI